YTFTTEISTLSLHDALPISYQRHFLAGPEFELNPVQHRNAIPITEINSLHFHIALERGREGDGVGQFRHAGSPFHNLQNSADIGDRKSTRLNSSHVAISYAV